MATFLSLRDGSTSSGVSSDWGLRVCGEGDFMCLQPHKDEGHGWYSQLNGKSSNSHPHYEMSSVTVRQECPGGTEGTFLIVVCCYRRSFREGFTRKWHFNSILKNEYMFASKTEGGKGGRGIAQSHQEIKSEEVFSVYKNFFYLDTCLPWLWIWYLKREI